MSVLGDATDGRAGALRRVGFVHYATPILSALSPATGPAAGEIPNLFSVRETPAMEAQAAEEAQLPPANLSASRIHDHNRLVDDVVQLLAERPKRGEKRLRDKYSGADPCSEEVATAWPENL